MHGLTCSEACGIFPHQGLNPRLLHWQADSLPLSHQGSPVKLFLLSFTYCSFWKEFSMCSPCLKRGDLCCFPLRMEYLHKLFGILLHGRFFFSFMYSIIYLCKYGLLHIYFILWDIIQCYFILLLRLFQLWVLADGRGGGLSVSLLPSLWSPWLFSDTSHQFLFSLSQFKWGFLSFVTTGFLTALKRACRLHYMLPIFLLCQCSWLLYPGKEPILFWAVTTTSLSSVKTARGLGDGGGGGQTSHVTNLWASKGAQRGD